MVARLGEARSVPQLLRTVRTPVLLALLLALLGYGLWWGWTNAVAPPRPRPTAEVCATAQTTPFDAARVTVGVYNGGARGGTAGQVADNLKRAGFGIRTIANTDERVAGTIVRGARADDPGVQLVAGFFPGARVEGDGRADDGVDVLVGREFSPMSSTAPTATTIPAEGCGPTPSEVRSQTASPTASPS